MTSYSMTLNVAFNIRRKATLFSRMARANAVPAALLYIDMPREPSKVRGTETDT